MGITPKDSMSIGITPKDSMSIGITPKDSIMNSSSPKASETERPKTLHGNSRRVGAGITSSDRGIEPYVSGRTREEVRQKIECLRLMMEHDRDFTNGDGI